jgi:glycosyltransferase involved in cell wall biosynthesis
MKIAHVVDSMEVGGAETVVAQMCRMQRDQGHDPRVYAVASLGPLGEQLRREGFVVEANVARHLSDALPGFHRVFRKSRPDVVHMHNPTPTIYAAPAAVATGVPNIISTRHSLVAPPRRLSVELKYGVAAMFCDWVVGICDATVENLRSLHTIPKRKIVRVYNGTSPIKRVPLEQCPPKEGFTFLFVGRLAPVKNLSLLLNAFHLALANRPDLRLWVVGDGGERTALEHLATELKITREVTFWGQQLDVAPFFSAADAFIMSSFSEGLPMALLQGLSVGLPAIVADVGGMAEIVRLARAGITVPPQDTGKMAEAIASVAGFSCDIRTLSQNAETTFQSQFMLDHMISGYAALYGTRSPR